MNENKDDTRDAARYRFLREDGVWLENDYSGSSPCVYDDVLDAAVDAAMADSPPSPMSGEEACFPPNFSLSMPAYHVVVPVEPTDAMLDAPSTVIQRHGARLVWQRMLAAAPWIGNPAKPIG